MENKEDSSLMHDFNESKASKKFPMKIIALFIAVVLLGTFTGLGLSKTGVVPAQKKDPAIPTYSISKGKIIGTDDIKDFPDTAEGTVRKGGIEGEGSYHLERPGGESQNVYMTSSIVDMEQLIGKKVKVWGATQTAQKAGWLMDVGRVEVL